MQFCLVNNLTIVNRFVLHTLHRNITRLDIITRKTTQKNESLRYVWEGGGS